MAAKRLTTDEMVQISGPWITKGSAARTAIAAVPEMAGLLPRVDEAHQALHDAQPSAGDPRLAALQDEAASVDAQHDTLIRGVSMTLTALALLSDAAKASALLKLQEVLLPDGLGSIQKTFRAEAGAAELLKTRLAADPSLKKQLKDIPVFKHTLGHFVEEWLGHAKRLGELEDERAAIVSGGPGDGAKLLAARNQWVRAVNALVANAAMAELDEPTDQLIFGAFRLAEKTADRRAKASSEAPSPAPE